jgi:hypothetical protein
VIGKIFVTRSGYDPTKGRKIKDPYLGPNPSLGACRPDIREQLNKGDHIFVVTGKVPGFDQVVLGGFEIAEKITAMEAYERIPEQRLRMLDGELDGNIIVNAEGKQHELDYHDQFERRIKNYVVGVNPIALLTPEEVEEGRRRTLDILREVLGRKGNSIRELMGRHRNLAEEQINKLRSLLDEVKSKARQLQPKDLLRELTSAARVAG